MLVLVWETLAWAAIVEPGYVESCVPALCGKRAAKVCHASFQGREDCEAIEKAGGWTQACRTAGASVYSEVFCEGAEPVDLSAPTASTPEPAPAVEPPKTESSRCQTGGMPANALLGVGLLGVLRRRRR